MTGAHPGGVANATEAGDPGPSTRERIPSHLRRYVVEQSYGEYNAVDRAVWRFVLTQIYDTLRHTAHPAYEEGIAQTGIALDHIPRIDEMDRRLRRYGWGAVCVDGFIPPRAFVEFQALGILPIAADIRSKRHLVYTPAPDIIHEAAGHAPILPDPAYAAYLKRIGHVGATAFSSREDARVYEAIFRLSEVKERPDATERDVLRAERAFAEAVEAVTRTTEATRMSRLYWWTAEYGLVGTPESYKLFGAGLLSSLGESHSCHAREVRKVPLSVECLDVSYDITRAQPQLFVARDFDHLEEVLDDASRTLAAHRGGVEALREAELSGDVATLTLGEGGASSLDERIEIIATVHGHEATRGLTRIQLGGPVAIASGGHIAHRLPELRGRTGGPAAEVLVSRTWSEACGTKRLSKGAALQVDLGSGSLRGIVDAWGPGRGPPSWVSLVDPRLGDEPLPTPTVLVAGTVLGARAGAVDPSYYGGSLFPGRFVPEPRRFSDSERELLGMYESAAGLTRRDWGTTATRILAELHDRLRREFPDEWLLRWNLLETLVRSSADPEAQAELRDELERLEVRFARAEPIALGLRHLARLAAER